MSVSSPRIYSYVIEHDLGFAPNPFFGACTLACCKPKIRQFAREGDYVIGTGAAKPKLQGHLCYWMRVDEILSFDDYWRDARFRSKRPNMGGSRVMRYGDNIYHRQPGAVQFSQEDSFHSFPAGALCEANLRRDTGSTDRVLIGWEFAYWGRSGFALPAELSDFVRNGPSHKCRFSQDRVDAFLAWLATQTDRGFLDEPAHWQFVDKKLARLKARKTKNLAR